MFLKYTSHLLLGLLCKAGPSKPYDKKHTVLDRTQNLLSQYTDFKFRTSVTIIIFVLFFCETLLQSTGFVHVQYAEHNLKVLYCRRVCNI